MRWAWPTGGRGEGPPPATTAVATGPSSTGPAATQRIWFAQALRGIACLIVVWEHLSYVYLVGPDVVRLVIFTSPDPSLGVPLPGWLATIYRWATTAHVAPGHFGVSLFFLISGFVIPFSLERLRLAGFFVRRFFRLYPTLWAGIAVSLAALGIQAYLVHNGFPVGKKVAVSSASLTSVYVGQAWVDPVYWTLAIEELFYVIAAVLAWKGLLHRRMVVASTGVALMLVSIWMAQVDPVTTYVPRFWFVRTALSRNTAFVIFILVGVAFHQHYRGRWSTRTTLGTAAALLAAFVVSLLLGAFPGAQPGIYLGSSVAALGVFTALYVWRDHVPRSKALDALANLSYPLYLIHTVVGWVLLRALYHVFPEFYVAVPLTLAACLAIAAVIHWTVELPSNELGRRIVSRPRFRRSPPPAEPVVSDAPPAAAVPAEG